jgi:sugar lactone lactonase YvrE
MVVDLGGLDPGAGYPWVGLHSEQRMLRLDPDDGSVIDTVTINVSPYGAALDSLGSIWISSFAGMTDQRIQRIDSESLEVDPPVVLGGDCYGPYGIATDTHDRVWVATFGDAACRYDPEDGSWFRVAMPVSGVQTRGIAVDPFDVVWVAGHDWGVSGYFFGFDAEDGGGMRNVSTRGSTPVGIAVDATGYIWAVNQGSSNASRLDPATEEVSLFPVGNAPYTYSDFTGFQRARIWSQGSWTTVFERCPDASGDVRAEWRNLIWTVETPASSSIELRGQTADDEADLEDAEAVELATVPSATPPVDIEETFEEAGIATGRFLLITVTLRSAGGTESPVLEDLEVSWQCDDGPIG